jgi:hypothetical protein
LGNKGQSPPNRRRNKLSRSFGRTRKTVAGLVSTVPALKLYALPALKLYALSALRLYALQALKLYDLQALKLYALQALKLYALQALSSFMLYSSQALKAPIASYG